MATQIIEYLHLQNADPTVLRVVFGLVLLYCVVGLPLALLQRKSRR